jgi:hypothetical protein
LLAENWLAPTAKRKLCLSRVPSRCALGQEELELDDGTTFALLALRTLLWAAASLCRWWLACSAAAEQPAAGPGTADGASVCLSMGFRCLGVRCSPADAMELGEDGLGRVSIGLGLSVFCLILVNHLAASLRQSLLSAQRERE